MRAYFFGNLYMSSIQQGIQAAHAVADMFIKYSNENEPNYHPLREWATDHKTMILLNAGYSSEIRNLVNFFQHPDNPYPWCEFHEGQDALDGALTTVGIILPEEIYGTSKQLRDEPMYTTSKLDHTLGLSPFSHLSTWQFDLALRLNNYGLAR